MPPLDAPDEARHFSRAYMISEGRISVPGLAPGHAGTIPLDLVSVHGERRRGHCQHSLARLREQLQAPFDPQKRAGAVRLTTTFPPVAYLPQAAAIRVGEAAGLSALWLLYLGRLANLFTWMALCSLALKIAPKRRWPLLLLCLSPISLSLASSLTADAWTNGVAILLFAVVSRRCFAPAGTEVSVPGQRLGAGDSWVLVGVGLLLGLAKPGYWPLAGLVWLIPRDRFRHPAQARLASWGSTAAIMVPSFAWAAYVQSAEPFPLGPQADPAAQWVGVLEAPWQLVFAILTSIWLQWIPWLAGFVGVLGRLDVRLPWALYAAYPLALLLLCAWDGPDPPALSRRLRLALAGLFTLGCVCILTMAYLGWNPVGAPVIADVHGRYFIPLAPLAFLAVAARRELPRHGPWWVALFCTVSLSIALYRVGAHYYFI